MEENSPDLPAKQEILGALERVLSSKEFSGADRLREFLTYVVTESVEGRGDKILGKLIAQDVYQRRSEEDIATANVVRVDAGRLRRRLSAYYSGEGAADPLRIEIAKGGYSPQFERGVRTTTQPEEVSPKRRIALVAGIVVVAFLAPAAVFLGTRNDEPATLTLADDVQRQKVERSVLFEMSPTALQAKNLAEEAQTMLFPATQPTRLQAGLTLFERAIELSPDYYGGYAGAAQAASMFGGLAPDGPDREKMLAKARSYAEEALRLAPSEAWSQSAMALLLMFERRFNEANRYSTRAVELDPTDLIVREFDAIIAFFSGDFDRAIVSADPEIHAGRVGSRFPWRNVLGNASFYLGDYQESIDHLLEAAASGEPVSEINSAHLIASFQAAGRIEEARKHMVEYEEAWPDSRIEEFMYKLFRSPEDAENLMTQLKRAGWQP